VVSATHSGFVPIRALIPWPEDLFSFPATEDGELDMIDRVGLTSWEVDESDPEREVYRAGIALVDELAVQIPGLEGFSLVFGAPAPGSEGTGAEFTLAVGIGEPVSFAVEDVDVALRMRQDLLRPVERGEDGAWVAKDEPFELRLEGLGLKVDLDGNVELTFAGGAPGISMPAFSVSDSGIVVEADQPVRLHLSGGGTPPGGQPQGWRGVHIPHAAVHLPNLDFPAIPSGLEFTDCSIGSGGFTGDLDATWAAGSAAGSLLGVDFELRHVGLDFVQSAPVNVEIGGQITLPFFDQPVGVDLGVGVDGSVVAALSAVQPPNVTEQAGLVTFSKPGLMDVTVDGLGLEFGPGRFLAKISGRVKLDLADIEWPEVGIQELSIDQDGRVQVKGGWLDLDQGYALEFYGFRFEITKLGFGHTDDGGRWIGFSGGLKLVEGMPAGASVEGLRVTWFDDGRPLRVSLDGVGVEFEVPGTVRFKGAVSYKQLTVGSEEINRFDGDISLALIALDLRIDAALVIGTATAPDGTYTFFAIFLGVELPAGIPLGNTGLGLYGFAGLFALNMEPGRRPEEPWYGVGPNDGWYKRPTIGVTDLRNKWENERGSIALGAGTTIGTVADNGFTFAGRILLVLVIPGPIIMLEGKANLLKERASLADDPLFRLLAVLDFRAGHVLVGLDAAYKQGTGAELIDVRGGSEVFFDFNDPGAWHIYLGEKEPREKRIQAQLFQLFDANAYFMLDARSAEMGAWIGFDEEWAFGPLRIDLEAWLEGGATLSFKPIHFTGYIWLHAKLEARVFGIGFTLSADARASADVFDPMHLLFELQVRLELPWPLPDAGADVTLEWGPTPTAPPLPLPLKEVAVEHFKATTSWPLPRGGPTPLLLPSYDPDGDGFRNAASGATQPADLDAAPVVPLDARPHITFGRAVHDEAQVGVNAQPVQPNASPAGWEWIGDPAKNEGPVRARFRLTQIALEKRTGNSWTAVAQAPAAAGVDKLYGSWAPVPALPAGAPVPGSPDPVANTKLWLWSKSAFDYTRASGRSWDEWFAGTHPSYPCVPDPPDRTVCCDFQDVPVGTPVKSPWRCEEHPEVGLAWSGRKPGVVTALAQPVDGLTRALCFPEGTEIRLTLPPGAEGATIVTPPRGRDGAVTRRCATFDEKPPARSKTWQGIALSVRDHAGAAMPLRVVDMGGPRLGLDCGFELIARLPEPSEQVELELASHAGPVEVEALARKRVVDATVVQTLKTPVRVVLRGRGIDTVVIRAKQDETLLFQLCHTAPALAVTVEGEGAAVTERDGRIRVRGKEKDTVRVVAEKGACVVRVCVELGPDPAAVDHQRQLNEHMRSELERWSQTGEVLEPDTRYRVRVVTAIDTDDGQALSTETQTEYAYFRTAGPPGVGRLSTPVGATAEFQSGLDDLTRYVEQTVPPTVPALGERPPLPRPVYRAYDVGARFNEDYVDLMYRRSRRDLTLQLFDSNNEPVRDPRGRLAIAGDQWGTTGERTLTESELRWIWAIESGSCAQLDPSVVPHDRALTAADGHVLVPDSVHEARLVPLLLHDAFTAAALSGWTAADSSGTSAWAIRSHLELSGSGATATGNVVTLGGAADLTSLETGVDSVELASDTARATRRYTVAAVDAAARKLTLDGIPALSGGSSAWKIPALGALVQPAAATSSLMTGDVAWTDVRATVVARAATGAAGVLVRAAANATHYRFSIDRVSRRRQLVRLQAGNATVLAEDRFSPRPGFDYELTLEAVDGRLRAFVDGARVFDVEDAAPIPAGRVGVWSSGAGARFRDMRVDDLREGAPVVYRFKFTTGRFATFVHHLHSGSDELWRAEADVSAHLGAGAAPSTPVGEAEQRAFEALAADVLGSAARRETAQVEVTRVEQGGAVQGLLVEASEPVDWGRVSLALAHASGHGEPAEPAAVAKLVASSFADAAPNDDWVELLLRDSFDPSGLRVERRTLPAALDEASSGRLLFAADLAGPGSGLLHDGPGSGDGFEVLDPQASAPTALLKAGPWGDVRVSAILEATSQDVVGVVLRHDGAGSGYRFAMSRSGPYRRLVKSSGGQDTVLWEDDVAYAAGTPHRVVVEAHGSRLLGWMDDVLLFDVEDHEPAAGRVGLHAFGRPGVRFESLRVESLGAPPVLWRPALGDLSEVEVVDHPTAPRGPSEWKATGGVVSQSSPIGQPARPRLPAPRGSFAAGGDPGWTGVQATVRLRSDGLGPIGVAFRYLGPDDHYRFVMDRRRRRRALERVAGGRITALWSDAVQYQGGRDYDVTVRAEGAELTVVLDGEVLCSVSDDRHPRGRLALFCADNTGARFERVLVADRARRVGGWTIEDSGPAGGPSVWLVADGALQQTSAIGGGSAPASPGTTALTGPELVDARITARLRCDDDGAAGIVFRHTGPGDCYRLSLDSRSDRRRLVRFQGGSATVLWERQGSFEIGTPFTLSVDAIGSRLVGRLDGALLFDLVDATHPTGSAGVHAAAQPGLRVERFDVREPPLEARALMRDRFATGSTAGWTVVDEGPRNAPSAWATAGAELRQTSAIDSTPASAAALAKLGTTMVGGDPAWGDTILSARLRSLDDGAIGLVFRRAGPADYYRFSIDRASGNRRLVVCSGGTFKKLWEDAAGYDLGRPYDVTIAAIGGVLRGWIDGVPAFVVEDGTHAAGQVGLYCWGNSDARFSNVTVHPADDAFRDWLLDEGFETEVPGRWLSAGGTSVAGDPEWADYRVSVRLRADAAVPVGVLARHTRDGHYLVRLSPGSRELVRVTAGAEEVLWQDGSQGIATGREYLLTLDCVGPWLRGWLDGRPLFAVEDAQWTAGRVGIQPTGAADVAFEEVRVAAPQWAALHELVDEQPLAAGTRLRVHAGSPDQAPPRAPGVQQRFAAAAGELGLPFLPTAGARLRVVAPGGGPGHARDVRPAADHSAVAASDVRVLRRADGTAFFLYRAGGPLAAGTHRLSLTFRRDNRAADPGSLVLSQAGETASELAVLDIALRP
jgi:hypothetical protein